MTDNGIELPARPTQPLGVPAAVVPVRRRPGVWIGLAVGVLQFLDPGRFEPAGFVTWLLPLLALCYLGFGIARRRRAVRDVLTRQGAGLLLFATVALVTILVDAEVGQYVVAAGYLGHAAWDYAHRDGSVVPRVFVDVCVPLDVLIAASLVFAALR